MEWTLREPAGRAVVAVVVVMSVLAACTGSAPAGADPSWSSLSLAALDAGARSDESSRPDVATIDPLPPQEGGQWLLGGAIVGVGTATPGFWLSPELTAFTRVVTTSVSLDAPLSRVTKSAVRPDGVAVAIADHPSPLHGNPRPIVWRWTGHAGEPWREVPTGREEFGGPDLISLGTMTTGPDGRFWISGTWLRLGQRQVAATWISQDGTAWSRVDDAAALAGGDGEDVFGRAIAAGSRGIVLAGQSVRSKPGDPGHSDGVLWHSSDGIVWDRSPTAPNRLGGSGATSITSVVATPGGFVAAGWSEIGHRGSLATWTSSDGRTWQRNLLTHNAGSGGARLTDPVLYAGPNGVALVAIQGRQVVMATSTDGRHWRRRPTPMLPTNLGRIEQLTIAWRPPLAVLVVEGTAATSAWRGTLR